MKMKKLWFIVIVSLILGLGTAWSFKSLWLMKKLDRFLDNKNYIVVFQNNNELRATGGFMGSYAKLNTQCSILKAQCGIKDLEIQDIYVPDGQLIGHVDPPAPIQQAFGQGWWKLRDSNWDPDFNVAGEQMAWFFEQGGEKADGIIAINLSLVNKVLEVLGEIKLTDYPEKITHKTFYNLAQKYAEVGAFPGSTQKSDFLGAVWRGMIGRIKTIRPMRLISLIRLMFEEFKKGEILVWLKDKGLAFRVQGLDKSDYLYIVESNLGANKANCCVSRRVVQEIDKSQTRLVIKYQNDNLFEGAKPPYFWGGNYIDYLRIIIPKTAKVQKIAVAGKELQKVDQLKFQYGLEDNVYTVENRGELQTVGFWAVVPAQQEITVEIFYELPTMNYEHKIMVRHQPGMSAFPYKLVVNGKVIVDKNIDRDTVIPLD